MPLFWIFSIFMILFILLMMMFIYIIYMKMKIDKSNVNYYNMELYWMW